MYVPWGGNSTSYGIRYTASATDLACLSTTKNNLMKANIWMKRHHHFVAAGTKTWRKVDNHFDIKEESQQAFAIIKDH